MRSSELPALKLFYQLACVGSKFEKDEGGGKCPLTGGVQDQAGWALEQPGLVGDVPAHSRD